MNENTTKKVSLLQALGTIDIVSDGVKNAVDPGLIKAVDGYLTELREHGEKTIKMGNMTLDIERYLKRARALLVLME